MRLWIVNEEELSVCLLRYDNINLYFVEIVNKI